jgi:uncharacterized protein (DUF1501 family)
MTMSRRKFLSLGGATVAAGAAGVLTWQELVDHHVHQAASSSSSTTSTTAGAGHAVPPAHRGRVLIVVDLGGGNDGLNTLVPSDGRYRDARPTLAVAESGLIALKGTTSYGLNPVLKPLTKWWDAGHLVAVDGVAIPDQTRSHFMASDVWWTAMPTEPHGTGWLGRWLDAQPDPSNPLRAVSLGFNTLMLNGERSVSTVIADPTNFSLMTPAGADADTVTKALLATARPSSADLTMADSQQAIPDAIHAVDVLTPVLSGKKQVEFPAVDTLNAPVTGQGAAAFVPGKAGGTGEEVSVTGLLEAAAGIIELGIGTQVVVVSVTGFDTHADQADRQAPLLTDVAQGLDGFLSTMAAKGHADDVLVLTISEFGRRVAENGSGTDHGQASVQFLAGAGVHGGQVVGSADLAHLDDGDLPIQIDTRCLYAAALDWLGGPTDEILHGHFDRHDLVTL